jgi:pimeloyl-ACP methyl ester carboxylesterase
MKISTDNIQKNVRISAGNGLTLEGILEIPKDAIGLIIFVHGSGSSRHSPRNTYVAKVLQQAKFATLLFDLLTEEEDSDYSNRFNIELLSTRLEMATVWTQQQPETKNFKIGYFGASTGAAAAIQTAARMKENIFAIVSRGGRPDLANEALKKITAPTLLIVGGADLEVLELNLNAKKNIAAETELAIVPNATHLFEEPGALEKTARLATNWFEKYLALKK